MATSSLRASSPRESSIDVALLILRLMLGILILLHGLSKLPPPPAFIVDVVDQGGPAASFSPTASTSARSSRRSCSSSASGRDWRHW